MSIDSDTAHACGVSSGTIQERNRIRAEVKKLMNYAIGKRQLYVRESIYWKEWNLDVNAYDRVLKLLEATQ